MRSVNFPWAGHQPVNVQMSEGEYATETKSGDKWEHHTYKVTIHYQGRMMRTRFSQGMAYAKDNVDVAEILYSLASDYLSGKDESFEEWAEEYGYDTDSRKAYATYRELDENRKRMDRVFGAEVSEFIDYFYKEN